MPEKKTALFFIDDYQWINKLLSTLNCLDWYIQAPPKNILHFKQLGFPEERMSAFHWGDEKKFSLPPEEVFVGIRAHEKDQDLLHQRNITKIDLVCVDFKPIKEHLRASGGRRAFRLPKNEKTKVYLVMEAISSGKLAVCETFSRDKAAEYLNDAEQDSQQTAEEINDAEQDRQIKLLEGSATALLKMAEGMFFLGQYCHRLAAAKKENKV